MTATRLLLVFLTLYLAGCAGDLHHREGMSLIEDGKIEEGLSALNKAVEADPTNGEFRKDLYVRRSAFVNRTITSAQSLRQGGKSDEAEALYRRVLAIDPGNSMALTGLEDITRDRRHAGIVVAAKDAMKAGNPDKAASTLRPVLNENPAHVGAKELKREIDEFQVKQQNVEPSLRGAYGRPVNLEFRDANVRMIFEGLARTTGINFIIDKDVRPDLRTTVFLKNTMIDDAIELILQTSQLQRKILNSNTVLVYPNSPEKVKDYQDLMVKGFYLQSADVKQMQTTLKTLLKIKDMVIDEKLNLITIRDTPEAIRLAEKVVAMHDLSEPEVMLEVEVMEIQRSRLIDLGIQWPNKLTLSPLATTAGGKLTADDLRRLNAPHLGAAISDTVINLRSDTTDTNLLANPRIRARNHEKAKVMIGDKVPVVTATTTATGIVSDSVQYLDVGLKLEVEPDIHLQDDVAIKVGMEVSSIVKQITTPNGTLAYQIGTRNANTMLQLKDGETQILAGLINDQDRRSGSGIPGLSDLPILGRLFSGQQNNRDKTEIVLSITPRIVRNVQRPDAGAAEFWSGTESALRTKPLTLAPMKSPSAPVAGAGSKSDNEPAALSDRSAPLSPAKSVELSWQGPSQVKVGDTFKVALRLKSDGTLRSLPFQAAFDSSSLQAVEITEGGFFKQDGGTTSFSSNIDAANGKVFVSVTRSDVEGAVGDDAVSVLTLRALAAKAPAELKLLSASPIVQGEKPATLLPPPYSVTITP
ncbi:MAG: general secretion pathway protein GspD [Deltaproteobacteria bacterium]|nr:general secretion pathway protein GspD [Deltaproteobacteria bacterium]